MNMFSTFESRDVQGQWKVMLQAVCWEGESETSDVESYLAGKTESRLKIS